MIIIINWGSRIIRYESNLVALQESWQFAANFFVAKGLKVATKSFSGNIFIAAKLSLIVLSLIVLAAIFKMSQLNVKVLAATLKLSLKV